MAPAAADNTHSEHDDSSDAEPLCIKADDEEIALLLQAHDGFIFDLDGTIWKGNTLIPGAKEVLELLRAEGKRIFFVTNNSSKSRAAYATKLNQLGIQADVSEVYGSSHAAAMYLKSKDVKKAYVIGEEGMVEELQAQKIVALGGPADNNKQYDLSSGESCTAGLDPEVKAVVVGLDRAVNYYKLQTAMSYLLTNKALFVATNTDSRGHLASEDEWAGAGTMVAAIIGCSELEPMVVGKPQPLLMNLISRASGLSPNRLCMVGDRLDTDIEWAHNCGAASLLVLTGCTTEEQALSAPPSCRPHLYVNSLADLLTEAAVTKPAGGGGSCTIS